MKITTTTLVAAFVFAGAATSQAALLITGVMDGDLPGGEPKAMELYNTGGASLDLSDYTLRLYSNGSAGPGSTSVLSGSISAGGFAYLLGTGDTPEFVSLFGNSGDFANAAEYSTVNANGNDVYEVFLTANPTLVDRYGVIGTDGAGEAWEFLDSWAYRNDNNTTLGFVESGFTYGGAGALDGLDASQQGAAVPFGTFSPATTAAVPEPSAAILGAIGMLALFRRRR